MLRGMRRMGEEVGGGTMWGVMMIVEVLREL